MNEIMKSEQVQKQPILDMEDLHVRYTSEGDVIRAVNGVSMRLDKKRTLGLVGETGAGKTTTALSILRLIAEPPGIVECGKLVIDGVDVLSLRPREMDKIRGKEVSMIFQDPMTVLNPVFTVGEQIAETIELHENLPRNEAYDKAVEMLELVGIPGSRADEYPHQFSGGMKQRVVIAIALACNPKLLIADEPTTALDVTIQAQVLEMMKRLKQKYEMSMILITHDLGIVAEVCDEVAVMYAGRIVEKGTLEEVFLNTLHPYTEGLFNSLPNIYDRKSDLHPIPGMMPDPANLPEGCAFAARCKYASDACRAAQPESRILEGTHMVACIAYQDPAFVLDRRKGNV